MILSGGRELGSSSVEPLSQRSKCLLPTGLMGPSQGDYTTHTQMYTQQPLHVKWISSSCFEGISPPPTLWRQTKTRKRPHPCLSVQIISTLRGWLWLVPNELGMRGKWNMDHVSSLMRWYIIQQYFVMACIHSVNGSVKVTGVILLNYGSNHDPCHQ